MPHLGLSTRFHTPNIKALNTSRLSLALTGLVASFVVCFFTIGVASPARADEVTHRFLACGEKTYIMRADGKPTWSYPHSTRDGYVLKDDSVLLTLSKSQSHSGGAVVKVTPDGNEQLLWEGTQSEVNSAQPTASGSIVITAPAFRFDAAKHEYFIGDQRVPSVTQLLKLGGHINDTY